MSKTDLRLAAEIRRRRELAVSSLLSPREREVALTVARGVTNREASQTLFLSTKTIEMYLTRVYRKLGIHSRYELALLLAPYVFEELAS